MTQWKVNHDIATRPREPVGWDHSMEKPEHLLGIVRVKKHTPEFEALTKEQQEKVTAEVNELTDRVMRQARSYPAKI